MIKNYLKIILRNLFKHQLFTFVNILGLALGLSAFLLINAFIRFERSYDRFHDDYEQILRVTSDQIVDGTIINRDAMSFHPSGRMFVKEVPEIEQYTTSYKFDQLVFRKGDDEVFENKVLAADNHFLEIFNYPLVRGDITSALTEPNSLV
ncbi:MAG: ABC transporter permease, partial [Ekhidna sp.]|nr:ABC transporter permease [Ekhidna sp.]